MNILDVFDENRISSVIVLDKFYGFGILIDIIGNDQFYSIRERQFLIFELLFLATAVNLVKLDWLWYSFLNLVNKSIYDFRRKYFV